MIADEHFYRERMEKMDDEELHKEARHYCLGAGNKKLPKNGFGKSKRAKLIKTIIQTKRNQRKAINASPTPDRLMIDSTTQNSIKSGKSHKSGSHHSNASKYSHKSNKSSSHKNSDLEVTTQMQANIHTNPIN